MALSNIVDVNIIVAPSAVPVAPLDIVISGATLTAPQVALWGPNLIRVVTREDFLDVLADVGITDGEPLFEFLQVLFAQTSVPRKVYLGQRATPVAQVTNFDLGDAGAAADGLYRITLTGVNFDVNAVTQTRTQVVTSMIALIDADPAYGAVVGGDTEQIDVTAAEAGVSFSFATSAPAPDLWLASTSTPSVGMSTDLDAWEAERKADKLEIFWLVTQPEAVSFGLANDMAQKAGAFARDIAVRLRTDSATDADAATTLPTRTAARLAAFNYPRIVIDHIPTATDVDHAANIGLKMPTIPGSDTWTNKRATGVLGVLWTFTESDNLAGGPYSYFDRIESLGAAISQNVRVVDGTPLDVIRGADFLTASIIAAVLTKLTSTPAPPYTAAGFGDIGGAISSTLAAFVTSGFLAATRPDGTPGFTVTIPAVPPPGDALRVAGRTPDFTFTALVAGSIVIVRTINGFLIQ